MPGLLEEKDEDGNKTGAIVANFWRPFDWASLPYGFVHDVRDEVFKDYTKLNFSLGYPFYAQNIDSSGEKTITVFTNVYKKLIPDAIFVNQAWSPQWKCQGTTASRVVTFEDLSQNGVKLRNEREHQIRAEFVGLPYTSVLSDITPYQCYIIYAVKDVSNSYLDFERSGITWNNGGTLFSLDHKFDFGSNGLTINMDSLKINNEGDIQLGQSMSLINAGGNYDLVSFEEKVKPSLNKTKSFAFENKQLKNSVTASGAVNMQTGIATLNGNPSLSLNAKSYTLNSLDIDLAKIGDGEDKDQWTNEGELYKSANIDLAKPLTITINNLLAGGANDKKFKANDTMTLLNIYGSNTGTIITKYGNDTIGSSTNLDVDFSDASASGVAVTGARKDTLDINISTFGFLNSNYQYILKYTIGQKNVTGLTASSIDLSKTDGGFVADSGYTFDTNIKLDLSQTKFINPAQAASYTLLEWSKAQGQNGTITLTGGNTTDGKSATFTSEKYTVTPATNGVTAIGTKDITVTVNDTDKKVDLSVAENPDVSEIQLGTYDAKKETQTIGNLVSNGTINASGLSLTGTDISSLKDAAKYNKTLTLANHTGTTDFKGWNVTGDRQAYAVYDNGKGITGTLAGTVDKSDGNIVLKTDGLKSIAYKEIDFDTSDTAAVTLDGGKLGSVDVSQIYSWGTWWNSFLGSNKTMHLLDAKNLSSEKIDLVRGNTWDAHTLTDGKTTITTYHASTTKDAESISNAGMTLSFKKADQFNVTKTQTAEGKYDYSVDFTLNKKIVTDFNLGKITWTKGGEGLSVKCFSVSKIGRKLSRQAKRKSPF